MPLSDIVQVNIVIQNAGVSQAGFGLPLILSHSAAWATERVRFYTDTAGVGTDFGATSPEYLAATELFSQVPAPAKIAIGKAGVNVTQSWKITVTTVANNTVYKVNVGANTATYTSDGSATNDEIVNGLLAAVNALSGDTLTATTGGSSGSLYLVLTGDAVNNWNRVCVDEAYLGYLSLEQTHADPGLAAQLDAIRQYNDSWYALITLYNSKAYVLAAAAWAEANEKLYGAMVQDTPIINTAENGSATDVGHALKAAAYFRTFTTYHPDNGVFSDAAWFGTKLPTDPGSEDWMFTTLAGVRAVILTPTQQTNLTDKRVNFYYTVNSKNITAGGGIVASGEYIDVVRFRDWLKARIGERFFSVLVAAANAGKKIPFTDAGIAIFESELRAQINEGISVGGLADDPKPTITVPKVKDISTADKSARRLTGLKFTAVLAGSIHKIIVNGVISVSA